MPTTTARSLRLAGRFSSTSGTTRPQTASSRSLAFRPGLFAKFHEATGLEAPSFDNASDESFQATVRAAEDLFESRTSAEWLHDLEAAGYPAGPYNLPHEAIRDPQVVANDFVVELDHPTVGPYITSGMPMRMEKARSEIRGPSPQFAEHTTEVMAEIGLDPQTVAELVDDGTLVDGAGQPVAPD